MSKCLAALLVKGHMCRKLLHVEYMRDAVGNALGAGAANAAAFDVDDVIGGTMDGMHGAVSSGI